MYNPEEFDDIYKIVAESKNFNELKRKLNNRYVDFFSKKDGFVVSVAGQFAREGHHDKVEWLRQLGAGTDDIAFAYALAGNHSQVERYRKKHGSRIEIIVIGYAANFNKERINHYYNNYVVHEDCITFGFAMADNSNANDYSNSNYGLAVGYALGGHFDKARKYAKGYVPDIIIAKGFAYAGEQSEVKNHVDSLLKEYIDRREKEKDATGTTKKYLHASIFGIFQKSFKEKNEAVTALRLALKGGTDDLTKHLPALRNGKLGKELRAWVKAGITDILVGKPVRTVSDFVKALEARNNKEALSNPPPTNK